MSNKDLFIFIGPPGAGKGSLSKLCVDKLGLAQLSTGYLCRKHIAQNTQIGMKIDFAIKSGKLIADDIIIAMVQEWLLEHADHLNGIILDGFPRTRSQAVALHSVLNGQLAGFNLKVIRLSIAKDAVVERLYNRFICQNQECQAVYSLLSGSSLAPKKHMLCDACSSPLDRRSDDTLSTIHERLKTYEHHENDLVDFYKSSNVRLCDVNVEKPLEQVFEDFKKLVELLSDCQ